MRGHFLSSAECFTSIKGEHGGKQSAGKCARIKVIETLRENFGVESSLHYTLCRGKRHARIYIGSKGREKFIKIISPYILDCFKYKLPQYRHTPQRLNL